MGRTIGNVTVEKGTGADVGCKRDALAAVGGTLARAGDGAQRRVYSDARNRFVYKVEKGGYPGSNRAEYEAYSGTELRERGLSQYGSPVALFTVRENGKETEVLAMPFRVNGSDVATPAALDKARARGMFRLPDMHGHNYRVTANGRIKITDLGFGIARGNQW